MTNIGDLVVVVESNHFDNYWVGWSDNPEEYNLKEKIQVKPCLALYIGHCNHYAKLLLIAGQVVWISFSAIRGVNESK